MYLGDQNYISKQIYIGNGRVRIMYEFEAGKASLFSLSSYCLYDFGDVT
jgi:hypothetical protein